MVFLYGLRDEWSTVVSKKEEELVKYHSYASCVFKSM